MLSSLRLLRSRRVGPSTFFRMVAEHGSALAALDALPQVAAEAGVRDYAVCPEGVARAELAKARKIGAVPLLYSDPRYPASLAELPDAPPLLWCLGNPDLLARPAIAMVGARNASSLGQRMARKLAHDLGAADLVIVSGLARGIDTAAHDAALPTGTIAVVAGGVDVIYPLENAELTAKIRTSGLIVSEQPCGLQPQARHFPKRNRIISGLSQAVVVVEAAAKSGSLITARNALDQGREVLAVPGHPFDARASGCNILIRDGAVLVRGSDDILEALPPVHSGLPLPDPAPTARPAPPPPSGGDIAARVLGLLGAAPLAEDQLLRDLGLPLPQAVSALTELELSGRITRQPGGLIQHTTAT